MLIVFELPCVQGREGSGLHVLGKLNDIPTTPPIGVRVYPFILKPTADSVVATVVIKSEEISETISSPIAQNSSRAGRLAAEIAIPFILNIIAPETQFASAG